MTLKGLPNHVEYNLYSLDSKPPKMITLPTDALTYVVSYLSPEEAARFKRVCQDVNVKLNSPQGDVLWQPYLHRLKAIDPTINISRPPEQAFDSAWRYSVFKACFDQIKQKQNNELMLILHNKTQYPSDFEALASQALKDELNDWVESDGWCYTGGGLPACLNPAPLIGAIDAIAVTLAAPLATLPILRNIHTIDDLQDRESFLNEFNCSIIQNHINPINTILYLSTHHNWGVATFVTRLPEALFEDEDLKPYWESLQTLHCSHLDLTALPQGLNICKALGALICTNNNLKVIPDSISQLPSLSVLDCSHNHIEQLPPYLGETQPIIVLRCHNNALKTIPVSLATPALQDLDCSYNNIESISALFTETRHLNVQHNELQHLPSAFIQTFGYQWYTTTMAAQDVSALQRVYNPTRGIANHVLPEAILHIFSAPKRENAGPVVDDEAPEPRNKKRK